MTIFQTTLNQMLVLFFFIVIGMLLKRKNILPDNAGTVMSRMETYVLFPALIINNLMTKCTLENIASRGYYFIFAIGILAAVYPVAVVLSNALTKDRITKYIYRYSFMISNFGFVGNAVVNGVFGADMLFEFLIFTIPLSFFTYSVGFAWLVPGGTKKDTLKRALLNPTIIALGVGIVLGITNFPMPKFAVDAISAAASSMTPVAMLLTGFVIGGYKFKELITKPVIYFVSLTRLVFIPFVVVSVLKLLNVPETLTIVALGFLAMPLGLNTIVFPAAYGGDTRLGAGMALISSALAVITIPAMFAILL